jgi:ankyrin repeat protein
MSQVFYSRGRTAIFMAAKSCKPYAVEALISLKADVNQANVCGRTPLHVVAARESGILTASIIDFLAEAGAKVNKADHFGLTPIQVADQCREVLNISSMRCNGVKGGWYEGEKPLDIVEVAKLSDLLSDVEFCIASYPDCALKTDRRVRACGNILLSSSSISFFCITVLSTLIPHQLRQQS